MEVQSLNPSTWEIEAGNLCEFETSLVYTSSFRLARATIVRPLLKKKKQFSFVDYLYYVFCLMDFYSYFYCLFSSAYLVT